MLQQNKYEPSKIWNMDETGITRVHWPGNVVASKGVRQVAKITSGECSNTVTVVGAMSAVGTGMPPMFLYPRKLMVEVLMNGAPPQSIGQANPSGWVDAEMFVTWLNRFVKFTNSSPTNRHIIVMDGHHSHKSLAAVEYARSKMQPLDRTFYKSMKSAYAAASDTWMVSNPMKRISYYQMAGIFGTAYVRTRYRLLPRCQLQFRGLLPSRGRLLTRSQLQCRCQMLTQHPLLTPVPSGVAGPSGL